jgi:predicted 3-demethylubiquinone-9 3-methyltransferase (glyoxalase superfamily)
MSTLQKIVPFLWFADQAEEAASFYVSVFPRSRIVSVSRYGEAGREIHGRQPGSVMTVVFELDGRRFTALNGGPIFTFNEAVSFEIVCDTQDEVDHYWEKLGAGGDPTAQQCGWLKDRYGLSWQVVPRRLHELVASPDEGVRERALGAMMQMQKLDLAALERAAAG